MKILITNDDGFDKFGIAELAKAATKYGEVLVVAPLTEQSGTSHSCNFHKVRKLNLEKDIVKGVKTYSYDSTPADCVKLAWYYLGYEFDLVLSGVNNGYNVGEDISYSGTVGAIMECGNFSRPGIAFSVERGHKETVKENLERALSFVFANELINKHLYWNINMPSIISKGDRFAKQGNLHYEKIFIDRDGGIYQTGISHPELDKDENSDICLVISGYTSYMPLVTNKTAFDVLNKIK